MLILELMLLAILQGVTELFPISSLGHSVLVPAVLHWTVDREAPWFLPFIVVLHLGTATALFIYFWRDWWALISGTVRNRGSAADPHARLFWLLVAGTIPAGLLGLAFEHKVRELFGGFGVAAVFLIINGAILLTGDRFKRRAARHNLEDMAWHKAFLIGCAQALALIPGISRSGSTLVAGLMSGLDYSASARFSFLLATPIIGAAGLLEVPKLAAHSDHLPASVVLTILGGGLLAGVCAWLSVWFLMRYFKTHEVTALRPFGYYCILVGAGALLWNWF